MSNERTEQIKKILISAQQSNSLKDQLLNDIAEGKVHLLSAKEICKRLNLTEREFTALVKNTDPTYSPMQKNQMDEVMHPITKNVRNVAESLMKLDSQYQYSFPAPDLYVAGKARWTEDTLKQWLLQGAK